MLRNGDILFNLIIGSECRYITDDEYYDIRSYFMEMRLRIVFLDNQDFVRMKLRTLLRDHGYKRRTAGLNAYLRQCMYFYHIEETGISKRDIKLHRLMDMTDKELECFAPWSEETQQQCKANVE